ncbi:MAG: efflux RND transporter periplasmic adaptor subunit [Opitutales bacterium]|nr:efflux RND transporter periplasmic adaptor subunit [Opitutales bacterium]
MNSKKILSIFTLIVLAVLAASAWIFKGSHAHDDHGHDEHGHGTEVPEAKGLHQGRLLTDGDFTVELAIFESGVPPEFRAWFTKAGKPLSPADVKLSVTLIRPGKVEDRFTFAPGGDFARGDHEVVQPHSFDYVIVAEHAGAVHKWEFEAPEMQTVIPASVAAQAGVKVEMAEPADMDESVEVYGRVTLELDGLHRASARFAGVVVEVYKGLGDKVVNGDIVARVQNSQTLVTANVKSSGAGVVIARSATVGEGVTEGAVLFTIAGLERVWVELEIPQKDLARVKSGQAVIFHADDGTEITKGVVALVSPLVSAETQTAIARVVLPNTDGRWRPGSFVKGLIVTSSSRAPVTVKTSALQSIFDFDVVFTQHGDIYQARPLELGRRNRERVEVLKGLAVGETYVSKGSFLIKADISKSGASHDH